MAAPQASSRLEMLQARFQQKQLQEKEQKLLQLYDQQQQRAYQVVQRGSAGSNSSNHGGSTTSRTTTTTTTHTTSTSQGGKVRQMFDERRQTTVKGIDRSYPLEPLENKSRKQANTNGLMTQRNGNSMMNRQSVNVKRVTRADVNSNVNGGKPVVSYHEEIMRESFGPSVRRHDDEDEFGMENRVANGYYRHGADNEQEEILDRETVERNRMMAKIHLMEYDDSLKHHAKNDLENEEFPEYLMVDVPDRLPKRNVAKKLSQAEARLERFKNANAKRSNVPKQLTSTSNVIKKRSEQTIPAKLNSRRSEIAGTSPTDTRSGSSRMSDRSQRILENVKNFMSSETRVVGKISKRRKENSDTETFNQRDSPQSFFEKPIKAEKNSIYPRKALNGFKSLTADGKIFVRRSTRPQFFCKESERSATTMSIDRKSDLSGSSLFDQETLTKRGKSPHFFLSESEQSRTSESKSPIGEGETLSRQSTSPQYLYESKGSETIISSDKNTIDRGILKKRNTINFDKKLKTSLDQKASFKLPSYEREIFKKRNITNPQFFCKESERSATTMSIDRKSSLSESPLFKERNISPQFFCKESERSATTMSIDRKSDSSESPLFYQKPLTKQSKSPSFFLSESEQSRTTSGSKSPIWEREISSRQSASPQYLRYEFKRSETAMSTDRETTGSKSSEWNKKILTKRDTIDFDKKLRTSDTSLDRKTSLHEGEILKKRDTSPRFFCKETERFGKTMSIDRKISKPRSPSYNKKIFKPRLIPQLSSRKIEKRSATIMSTDRKYDESKSSGTTREKREKRTASPQFFCKESEKSATTMLIEPRSRSTDSTKNILKQGSHTRDIFYKSTKPLSSIDKINFSQGSPNPSIIKHEAKKALKKDEISNIITESRRSSRISETSAASTSSIVSLKYGLEFDNILQSAGLVRKFMKSQNEKQQEIRQSSLKQNIKNVNTSIAKDNQSKIRYKTSSPFQKASSPSIENRRRATPESPRKSITPIEVDMDIQEIIMTDHRIERDKLQKAASPIPRRQIDGTYTKSFSDKTKLKTSVTYPVRKIQKQRASILKSNVFKSKKESLERSKESKNHRTYRDSERNAISLNKLGCSPVSETSQRIITRSKEDENRVSKVKISQTQEQAWNKSIKNQAEFRSRKYEDQQSDMTPRSPKQIQDRSTETRISKAMSPDSSKKKKYSDDIVPCLRDPEERSGGTRTEFDELRSLQSARLVQDTLKEKNLSSSDEYNRERRENKNENVEINEVEAGIDVKYQTIVEIASNEDTKDYRKITRPNSTQSIDKDVILRGTQASTVLNISKEIKKECSRQHDIKSRILPRVPLLRKTVKISRGANTSKILPSQRVTSKMNQNTTSKFLKNTDKDNKDKSALIMKKSANLFNKTNAQHKIEKSEDTAREFSKIITRRENESEKDFERMDSVESALRRFDSIGVEFEHLGPTSFRTSPEISLQVMDVQTKSSIKQTITSEGSTLIPSPKVTDNTILKSTPKSPVNKNLKVKNYLYKNDLKIPNKKICSSKRLENRIGNTIENKKSTQTRSPMCKRRLFESDSEKKIQESNYTKTRKKENYSSISSHKDKAISKVRSSKDLDRKDAKESKGLQEMPMLSVKPLRSIEDIRKSIDNERNKIITANESRSAIANRRSVSRQDVDARRSISATDAAKNIILGDDPARLTKAKSCLSRITKSPSPDSITRKHHETNTRATRRSAPSSPSKSPDIASKCASTEAKNQEAKPSRKSAVAKGENSTGSKTITNEIVDIVDGVALENDSSHESTPKKSDVFIIDSDDQPAKENDIAPSKKTPIKKSSSNQQTASGASDRPTSSNSNASLTHGQVSSTKSKMTTRAKTPTSAAPQAKGSLSAKPSGTSTQLVACKICGRTFASDRISCHEKVCTKVVNIKRKKFDAMTFRIRGTELEPFVKKSLKKPEKPQVKSDWRRKHEDFINAIRSAKQLQAHLAAGGSLKDLPPPPPSDTSDYIQCPHCKRKFNQAAAERHIPKCETMLHNKPAHLRISKSKR
ncbi:uncharacterized protein LOC126848119 [Cataglyphis hispanica]|uniref:uncharacterized protein LOC126848119 n=1 Tax=Cataglyphis hispanica TaxID=1086592 RepID=UPI00217F3C17|nr:uncharacterized protein LOC126848119 [Cataglyphis hispanica]